MLNQTWSRALACIGAVVGAGFASGREVMVFFSQYGWFSWPLILLSTGLMCMICSLVMRKTRAYSCSHWCSIYQGRSKRIQWLGEGCVILLMGVTGGAMVSASGNLVALALPIQHAYWVGVITTLLLSYFLTQQNLKPLALLSAFLILGILASYVLILAYRKEPMVTVNIREPLTLAGGVKAVLFSAAYSGMNMAISLGVVCKCAQTKTRTICRSSLAFGLVLTGLLFISNHVLLQYGDLQDATFPIVRLLSSLGQSGFWISLVVLYLAVFTTLTAILCTLRNMAVSHHLSAPSIPALTLGVPLLFSLIGFEQIVESVYAPVGLACLLLIFIPIILRRPFRQKN